MKLHTDIIHCFIVFKILLHSVNAFTVRQFTSASTYAFFGLGNTHYHEVIDTRSSILKTRTNGLQMKMIASSTNIELNEELDNVFALMVLRQFSSRISNALLFDPSNETTWKFIDKFGLKSSLSTSIEERCEDDRLTVIEVPTSRQGRADTKFNILIIRDAYKLPSELPATARQQISWCHNMNYQFEFVSDESDDQNEQLFASLSSKIYEGLLKKSISNKELCACYLRIDAFPKTNAPLICKALQYHATKNLEIDEEFDQNQIDEDDLFSGPSQN